MKLLCFSYAGGTAGFFERWNNYTRSTMQIIPIELPGRGLRFTEELCDNMSELVDILYDLIVDEIAEDDYMFYGHSMGAWVAYYLTVKIAKENRRLPQYLFLSGKEAPYLNKEKNNYHKLPDREFLNKIYELGGTPEELLSNQELQDIFIPIIRNDYQLIETCDTTSSMQKLDAKIVIFHGLEDDLYEEDLDGWQSYTNRKIEKHYFSGGHFFIHKEGRQIVYLIEQVTRLDGIKN